MNFPFHELANPALPAWLPLSVLAWLVHVGVYHGAALAFAWCDAAGALRRFKVRDVDRIGLAAMAPRVLFNQVFLLLPCMVACEVAGLAFVGESRLGPLWFVVGLLGLAVGHDVFQYVAHRGILHHPCLMKPLGHQLHHATGASKAMSACYMSAPDFFLEIVCPYLLPLMLIGGGGSDIAFHLVAIGLGSIGGLYEHSGYDFGKALPGRRGRLPTAIGGAISSHAHAEHHRRFVVSFSDGFGSSSLCDAIFGTRWDRRPGARPAPRSDDPADSWETSGAGEPLVGAGRPA